MYVHVHVCSVVYVLRVCMFVQIGVCVCTCVYVHAHASTVVYVQGCVGVCIQRPEDSIMWCCVLSHVLCLYRLSWLLAPGLSSGIHLFPSPQCWD